MPLYEFQCEKCEKVWEAVARVSQAEAPCPHCDSATGHRIVSRFAVGGRGDLRESTLHGCHDHFTGVEEHDHSHHHDHEH